MSAFRVERWTGAEAPNTAELRGRLEAEGYGVFQWSDPPGRMYPPHAHGEDQSHWVISGALELTVDGESYVLGAGDRDFLPAGTIHSAEVTSETPVVYLIGAK